MKAWQFVDTHSPLTLTDKPTPRPSAGEVLIRVRAAGICHSDVSLFEDEKWISRMSLPVVPGHEIAGEIVDLGSDVRGVALGDRVVIWTLSEMHGYRRDGGFGELVLARPESLVAIPNNVSFEEAIFAEPGMTAHAAVVRKGHVSAGQKVGIIGFGGLGQLGARMAELVGARVFVADLSESARERARHTKAERVVSDINELVDENLDTVVDFAGFGATTAGAISSVRAGGRVVLVGMGNLEVKLDTFTLISRQVTLIGNGGGGIADMEATLAWIASGDIVPTIVATDFAGIPAGIAKLARGEVSGRMVAAM